GILVGRAVAGVITIVNAILDAAEFCGTGMSGEKQRVALLIVPKPFELELHTRIERRERVAPLGQDLRVAWPKSDGNITPAIHLLLGGILDHDHRRRTRDG